MSSLARSLEKHLKTWLPELVEESNIEVEKVTTIANGILNKAKNMKPRKLPDGPDGSISIAAGARKYGRKPSTISYWYNKGWIPLIVMIGNRKYIDDGKLAELVQSRPLGRGYWRKPNT